jgi:hypothetical protein
MNAQLICSTMNTLNLLTADCLCIVNWLTTEASTVRERDSPEQFDTLFLNGDTTVNFTHHLSTLYIALADMGPLPAPVYLEQAASGSGTLHSGPPVASGSGTRHIDDSGEDAEGSMDNF